MNLNVDLIKINTKDFEITKKDLEEYDLDNLLTKVRVNLTDENIKKYFSKYNFQLVKYDPYLVLNNVIIYTETGHVISAENSEYILTKVIFHEDALIHEDFSKKFKDIELSKFIIARDYSYQEFINALSNGEASKSNITDYDMKEGNVVNIYDTVDSLVYLDDEEESSIMGNVDHFMEFNDTFIKKNNRLPVKDINSTALHFINNPFKGVKLNLDKLNLDTDRYIKNNFIIPNSNQLRHKYFAIFIDRNLDAVHCNIHGTEDRVGNSDNNSDDRVISIENGITPDEEPEFKSFKNIPHITNYEIEKLISDTRDVLMDKIDISYERPSGKIMYDESLRERFISTLEENNYLISGGSVRDTLQGEKHVSDLDLYIMQPEHYQSLRDIYKEITDPVIFTKYIWKEFVKNNKKLANMEFDNEVEFMLVRLYLLGYAIHDNLNGGYGLDRISSLPYKLIEFDESGIFKFSRKIRDKITDGRINGLNVLYRHMGGYTFSRNTGSNLVPIDHIDMISQHCTVAMNEYLTPSQMVIVEEELNYVFKSKEDLILDILNLNMDVDIIYKDEIKGSPYNVIESYDFYHNSFGFVRNLDNLPVVEDMIPGSEHEYYYNKYGFIYPKDLSLEESLDIVQNKKLKLNKSANKVTTNRLIERHLRFISEGYKVSEEFYDYLASKVFTK